MKLFQWSISIQHFDFDGKVPPFGNKDHDFPVDRAFSKLKFKMVPEWFVGSVVNALAIKLVCGSGEIVVGDEGSE